MSEGDREEAMVTSGDQARADASEIPRRGRPTSVQREMRRRRMLEQSLQVFLAHGYQGSTLEELARASGVTKRTIYTDYGDKEGLFAAMVESLAGGISHGPGFSGETLESLASQIVYRIHSDELVGLHRLVIAESPRFPRLAKAFYQRTDARHIEALRAHLVGRHGASAGRLAPALFSLLLGERHRQRLLGVRRAASRTEAEKIARDAISQLGFSGDELVAPPVGELVLDPPAD
jgi:AcrR family transcriptional regulator